MVHIRGFSNGISILLCLCFLRGAFGQVIQEERLALLVGIDTYPNLQSTHQLQGCTNDVALVKEMLIANGYPESRITVLTNANATRNRITDAMDALATQVLGLSNKGVVSHVFFHFSGHGSQIPDQLSGEERDEPDFLDQTIVPSDAGDQGGETDIRDDDLRRWAKKITRDSSNSLFVVLDCCHSGTGLRSGITYRSLQRNTEIDPQDYAATHSLPLPLPKNTIVISACGAEELELEATVHGKQHGLLSIGMVETLKRVPGCRLQDLPARLREGYSQWTHVPNIPTPEIEFSTITCNNPLFNAYLEDERYNIVKVEVHDGATSIKLGLLHGLQVDDEVEIYDYSESTQIPVGVMKIQKVSLTSSNGEVRLSSPRKSRAPSNSENCNSLYIKTKRSDAFPKIEFDTDEGSLEFLTRIDDKQLLEGLVKDKFVLLNQEPANYLVRSTLESVKISSNKEIRQSAIAREIEIPRKASSEQISNVLHGIASIELINRLLEIKRESVVADTDCTTSLMKGVRNKTAGKLSFEELQPNPQGIVELKTGDVFRVGVNSSRADTEDLYATIIHVDPQFELTLMMPSEYSGYGRQMQRLKWPGGINSDAYVCNGESLLASTDRDFSKPITGTHEVIVFITPYPLDLAWLFSRETNNKENLRSGEADPIGDDWWYAKAFCYHVSE